MLAGCAAGGKNTETAAKKEYKPSAMAVSYTHLDVYKRQVVVQLVSYRRIICESCIIIDAINIIIYRGSEYFLSLIHI